MSAPTPRGGIRLRPGDVLEIRGAAAKWYLCYLGRHTVLGDTVWVLPQPYAPSAVLHCAAFAGDGYYAFYPATTAIRRKMVQRVGFCPEGMRMMPRQLRYGHPLPEPGQPRPWRIGSAEGDGTPFVWRQQLSAEEARIPAATLWNHAALLERLEAGWHPCQDGPGAPSAAV